jgi:hypothetical protein
MTPPVSEEEEEEAFLKKEQHPSHKKEYWQNELESLGVEARRPNELSDKTELEALAEMIKQVYYQDYKTVITNIVGLYFPIKECENMTSEITSPI